MKNIDKAAPNVMVFLSPILAITNTAVKHPNSCPAYITEFEISPNCPQLSSVNNRDQIFEIVFRAMYNRKKPIPQWIAFHKLMSSFDMIFGL